MELLEFTLALAIVIVAAKAAGYASVVIMVLATTLVAPILLRALYKAARHSEPAPARAAAVEKED